MQFLGGLALGVPLGFFGLVGGIIAMAAALLIVMLTGYLARGAMLAGALIGLGGFWLAMFVMAAANCAQPSQPCGATPVDLTPHMVVSIALIVAGVVSILWPRIARARRGSR
jgi:hypothetical protein